MDNFRIHNKGQQEIASSSYDQSHLKSSNAEVLNLIHVSENEPNHQVEKVDSIELIVHAPEKVPSNHVAVHVPSDAVDLHQLQPARFHAAQGVYLSARVDPEESLYARGKYWYGRMKNWVMMRPNEPRIEGVDQSFWGFSKDVAGAGWGFIYDQLKSVRAYGAGLFGFSSDVSRVREAEAQIGLHDTFEKSSDQLSQALIEQLVALGENEKKDIERFKAAKSDPSDEENQKTLKAFDERGIKSVDDILESYGKKAQEMHQAACDMLCRIAVDLNPDAIEEQSKVGVLFDKLTSLQAQLLIAEQALQHAQDQYDRIAESISVLGAGAVYAFKDLDRAGVALEKAKQVSQLAQRKFFAVSEKYEKAQERFEKTKQSLLQQEQDRAYGALQADADLGRLLLREASTSAMKTWTWSINDLLKTIQYGCTGVGLLNIPVVSAVALGISFVTGGLSLAMYGEDTVHRGKQAHHAGKVKSALNAMKNEEQKDPELDAIHKLIDRNLSYKTKGVKAFFTSLGIVSTLASLGVAVVNVLAIAGVVSATALSIASPVGWGIGGICLVAGLAFSAYSGAKAIYRYYQEYKAEKLLEEALDARDNPAAERSKEYNALFMEELAKVDEIGISVDEHVRCGQETLVRMHDFCAERKGQLKLLAQDIKHYRDSNYEKSDLYDSLFSHYMNVYLKDALKSLGYDKGVALTSKQQKSVEDYIHTKMQQWIDGESESIEAIEGDLKAGTTISKAFQDKYADVFRVVMSELEHGHMHDRVKIANERIVERQILKLMERRPEYGIRVLIQRLQSGDEAALKFVQDIDVFSEKELKIIQNASKASEPKVVELMMERLGFDT